MDPTRSGMRLAVGGGIGGRVLQADLWTNPPTVSSQSGSASSAMTFAGEAEAPYLTAGHLESGDSEVCGRFEEQTMLRGMPGIGAAPPGVVGEARHVRPTGWTFAASVVGPPNLANSRSSPDFRDSSTTFRALPASG